MEKGVLWLADIDEGGVHSLNDPLDLAEIDRPDAGLLIGHFEEDLRKAVILENRDAHFVRRRVDYDFLLHVGHMAPCTVRNGRLEMGSWTASGPVAVGSGGTGSKGSGAEEWMRRGRGIVPALHVIHLANTSTAEVSDHRPCEAPGHFEHGSPRSPPSLEARAGDGLSIRFLGGERSHGRSPDFSPGRGQSPFLYCGLPSIIAGTTAKKRGQA